MAQEQQAYATLDDSKIHLLYRVAVYLTADAKEAQHAIAACFSLGLSLGESTEPFDSLIVLLLEQLKKAPYLTGADYCQKLGKSFFPKSPDEQLCQLLCQLTFFDRAAVLLSFLTRLPAHTVARLLGCPPSEVAQAVQRFCQTLRRVRQPV